MDQCGITTAKQGEDQERVFSCCMCLVMNNNYHHLQSSSGFWRVRRGEREASLTGGVACRSRTQRRGAGIHNLTLFPFFALAVVFVFVRQAAFKALSYTGDGSLFIPAPAPVGVDLTFFSSPIWKESKNIHRGTAVDFVLHT